MISPEEPIVAAKETVFSDLGDEVAILNLKSGEYFGLNPVGAFVWQLIQEPRTLEEICTAVTARFEVDPDRCRHDVSILVEELRTHDLARIPDRG